MSKKRRVATDRAWPPELKGPFPIQQLKDRARERFRDVNDPEQQDSLTMSYVKKMSERVARRRVGLLAKFFGRPWPQSEVDWVRLIFMVCGHFEVSGFKIQRKAAGAPEKWISRKNQMLLLMSCRKWQKCLSRQKSKPSGA
jgi:hypothetical protein